MESDERTPRDQPGRDAAGIILGTSAFDITEGTTYKLAATRSDTQRTCVGINGATTVTATGTAPENGATGGFRVVRTKATYQWLMIVKH